MNKKRMIVIAILLITIVIVTSMFVTSAFMKPIDNGENLTSVSLSSCAKIKLTETSSIDISNSYPMSRNKGLQTTPYSFTVTSYCDSYVGFNMYVAILEDSTIDLKNIHYVITNKGSRTALQEGLLSELEEETTFSENEKVELRTGIKGNFSKIYNLYSGKVPLKGNREYDLYLFIDENATNDVMGKTFKAGVAIKSYDREIGVSVDEVCAEGDNLNSCVTRLSDLFGSDETLIYHHDGTLENGIDDGTYRYAGASDKVNNFVCFGSDEEECPNNNLYRIIGIIDGKVKLIKYDYATIDELGEDGDYSTDYLTWSIDVGDLYRGSENPSNIAVCEWNFNSNNVESNNWQDSMLNTINLNTNFLNSLSVNSGNKITVTTWKVGGNYSTKIENAISKDAYNNELVNSVSNSVYDAKIGLMYISDYGLAASPDYWNTLVSNYNDTKIIESNWMFMGLYEWTITPALSNTNFVNSIRWQGNVKSYISSYRRAIRPVFFLVDNSLYKLGNGTKESPIRIM